MFNIFHELTCTALETRESTSFSILQLGFAIALCSKSLIPVLLVIIHQICDVEVFSPYLGIRFPLCASVIMTPKGFHFFAICYLISFSLVSFTF